MSLLVSLTAQIQGNLLIMCNIWGDGILQGLHSSAKPRLALQYSLLIAKGKLI